METIGSTVQHLRDRNRVNKEIKPVQVAILLASIGEKALRIYNMFIFANEDDKGKLHAVKQKFANYFTPRSNVVFERYNFWRLTQAAGENIDAFVTKVRLRAQSCEFKEQEDSLIRDRIVLSCIDARIQERLLREPGLTVVKALELCRAAEATQQQLCVIKSGSGSEQTSFTAVVSAVSGSNQAAGNFAPRKQCGNCGTNHMLRGYSAFGKTCSNCGKDNHFATVCRSTNKPSTQQFR